MAVRGTTNYVYFTDRSLGSGASGNVYFGRHKRKGDPCAIKVFRSMDGGMKEMQLRQREFQVMSKLSHDNIVKFIAIEPESHGSDKVLIMELCTGGSVYKMLEDPEHAFGFPEDEFIIFLGDITKALQYLRHNGVVHRDIKPGNILRYIRDDLSSLYKLTDFGAARELPEDEEFVSLYGTEEYLHPDLYARALMRHQRLDQYPRSFNASVDLWSLGVTLYHVATGRLPFQPFGGRKNREAMHLIISKKDSGFISGVQQTKDGSIEWSRDLPKTCLLSSGLRKLLVSILVGLLESEKQRQWTFDNFFRASKDITSRMVVHAFSVLNCSQDRLYLGKEDRKSLTHFQDALADFTKIPSSQQLVFHENWSVESLIVSGSGEPISIQTTSPDCPLYVVPLNQVPVKWTSENHDLPSLPIIPPAIDVSEDAAYARNVCAFVIFLQRKTDLLLRVQNLLVFVASRLGNMLTTSSHELQLVFHSLVPMYEKLFRFQATGEPLLDQFDGQLKELRSIFAKVEEAVKKFSQDVTSRSLLLTEFLKTFSTKICPPSVSCSKKQAHFVKDLETIRNTFKEHKKKDKDLSYNEQQIHKFDRGRATEIAKRSLELYTKHCIVNTDAAWKSFQSFHNLYLKRKDEIERTEGVLQGLLEKIGSANEYLFNLLLAVMKQRRHDKKVNDIEQKNSSNKNKNERLRDQSYEDSAFEDIGSNRGHLVTSENDFDDRTLSDCRISRETVPEEVTRADSGIEMMAETLKDIIKDTGNLLKAAISTSDENNVILQKLCTNFPVPTNS